MDAATLRTIVAEFRDNERQIRRLKESRPTRNAGATQRALVRRLDERGDMLDKLLVSFQDGRHLVGALNDERVLRERLAAAKLAGQTRPELKVRLSLARRSITSVLNAAL